jgi:hypothetical protein
LFLGFSFSVNVTKCRYVEFHGKYRLCAKTLLIFTLCYGTGQFDSNNFALSQPLTT